MTRTTARFQILSGLLFHSLVCCCSCFIIVAIWFQRPFNSRRSWCAVEQVDKALNLSAVSGEKKRPLWHFDKNRHFSKSLVVGSTAALASRLFIISASDLTFIFSRCRTAPLLLCRLVLRPIVFFYLFIFFLCCLCCLVRPFGFIGDPWPMRMKEGRGGCSRGRDGQAPCHRIIIANAQLAFVLSLCVTHGRVHGFMNLQHQPLRM